MLVLGLLGRAGVGEVPDELTREPLLIAAGVMYAIEFVTDKIPYVDNTWDLISTAIRPAIGSVVGFEFAGEEQLSGIEELFAGGGSGAIALASHSIKTALRLGVNVSPEPFSNIVVSLGEDGLAAGVTALALEHPVEAAVIASVLLIGGFALVIFLWTRIRRAWRNYVDRKRGP